MRHEQKEALALMREVLQEEFLELHVESYKLEENFTEARCEVYLQVCDRRSGECFPIEGKGVGLVDAVFNAVKDRLSPEYPSLETIEFSAFEMKGIMSSGNAAHTDAEARVEVGVRNSYGKEFGFEGQTRSIAQSCITALLGAVEYFVNSERAFIRMHNARAHYKSEGREDLVTKYTSMMAQMVANTSYSEVLERIRQEIE